MKFEFKSVARHRDASTNDWMSWKWQIRNSLKTPQDFDSYFPGLGIGDEFSLLENKFKIQTTPYYAMLAVGEVANGPVRRILLPSLNELETGLQEQRDPLGENENRPTNRIIHRYSDRVLFLVTDFCAMYCRYCTRKHFTASDQNLIGSVDYREAIDYISGHPGVREVILSGGDPLTIGTGPLSKILNDLRALDNIEIIRIGSRMPVVCPMRVDSELVQTLRKFAPVYLLTHFNHPRELTKEAASALALLVDHGIPVFNQMVLLNGVNNHPAIVQALSRRLLYLRVKPYYAFQCDPSQGTDHLRTSIRQSEEIQRELWGHLSGLAMPNFSVDIPDGGGKAPLAPDFLINTQGDRDLFRGWDGIEAEYVNPRIENLSVPSDVDDYIDEWQAIRRSKL